MIHESEFCTANLKLREEIKKSILAETEGQLDYETDLLISTGYDWEKDIGYYEQSPIESLFILELYKLIKIQLITKEHWFITSKYGFYIDELWLDPIVYFKTKIGNPSMKSIYRDWSTLAIWPQYAIQCDKKKYRVDFRFAIYNVGDVIIIPCGSMEDIDTVIPDIQLCVEFDGHDYHERTKKQAQYDKQRDRDIKLAGYDIIHFTGSEVYKDWMSVFDQIIEAMLSKLGK